ncbi:uncharacterized protein RCC_08405 [Ramularia collo-cygni]|uniref:Uncharacterized protein n=1 Tax=Ramularia collo-cygni TaxID=112498 RepID=A0A2D3V743_9PEZI|nr:uncharacterized protein RCC_08405 [Ramularia collo-cygni]CZT22700.1 uncharacterized protein RCC_08405 [Ramularia collo-cygni]
MPDPDFNTPLAHLLIWIWKYSYYLVQAFIFIYGWCIEPKLPFRLADRYTFFMCSTYFFNFLMHSGLKLPVPLVGNIPIIPQFVPNTCVSAAEFWDESVWPCQRERMGMWIERILDGRYGWTILRDPEILEVGAVVSLVIMGAVGLVWGSGICPDAEWRKWKCFPDLSPSEDEMEEMEGMKEMEEMKGSRQEADRVE